MPTTGLVVETIGIHQNKKIDLSAPRGALQTGGIRPYGAKMKVVMQLEVVVEEKIASATVMVTGIDRLGVKSEHPEGTAVEIVPKTIDVHGVVAEIKRDPGGTEIVGTVIEFSRYKPDRRQLLNLTHIQAPMRILGDRQGSLLYQMRPKCQKFDPMLFNNRITIIDKFE